MMVARARALVRERGWDNVEVRQADATTMTVEGFDAAISTFSVSATPDVAATLERVRAALRPGGRLFVFDMRLVPGGRAAPLIRLFRRVYRRLAGWSGVDVLDTARATFAEVRLHGGAAEPAPWPPLVALTAVR
ncbi:Methyltransferase domain-containing protein [Actinokineospora iranica]|uniref:Methyltransferase domain-containing protein n=1 Tax=Actinokineospora iranica TaxID=1271860 RepID=A0A1G6IV03_9PSEU|nr:Methyltransferase domain-containing protein [Actinokineospora iranica]